MVQAATKTARDREKSVAVSKLPETREADAAIARVLEAERLAQSRIAEALAAAEQRVAEARVVARRVATTYEDRVARARASVERRIAARHAEVDTRIAALRAAEVQLPAQSAQLDAALATLLAELTGGQP
jgi:hypothetical protein